MRGDDNRHYMSLHPAIRFDKTSCQTSELQAEAIREPSSANSRADLVTTPPSNPSSVLSRPVSIVRSLSAEASGSAVARAEEKDLELPTMALLEMCEGGVAMIARRERREVRRPKALSAFRDLVQQVHSKNLCRNLPLLAGIRPRTEHPIMNSHGRVYIWCF